MSRMFIPMTKATGLGRLPQMLEQMTGAKPAFLAFQDAGLPMDIIEFPETRIPIEAMRDLFEISARSVGDRCFGLHVGQDMTHQAFGLWMKYSAQAATLAQGLTRSVACCRFQQSGGRLAFDATAPMAFFRYVAPPGAPSRPIQHCDHLIGPMMGFVRTFLGPDWCPEWVELDYPRDALSHHLEAKLPFPLHFDAPALSLAIRHRDLFSPNKHPVGASQTVTFGDVAASESPGPSHEPLRSVFNAITLRLLDGQSDIDGAARAMGVGVQRLQRSLRREGTEYRDLVTRAKRHRAQALLAGTTLPVVDIAFSLGYSDHANFSRSFKRMVGVTPMAYRNAQAQHLIAAE